MGPGECTLNGEIVQFAPAGRHLETRLAGYWLKQCKTVQNSDISPRTGYLR